MNKDISKQKYWTKTKNIEQRIGNKNIEQEQENIV